MRISNWSGNFFVIPAKAASLRFSSGRFARCCERYTKLSYQPECLRYFNDATGCRYYFQYRRSQESFRPAQRKSAGGSATERYGTAVIYFAEHRTIPIGGTSGNIVEVAQQVEARRWTRRIGGSGACSDPFGTVRVSESVLLAVLFTAAIRLNWRFLLSAKLPCSQESGTRSQTLKTSKTFPSS